jgi:hypothetical protein
MDNCGSSLTELSEHSRRILSNSVTYPPGSPSQPFLPASSALRESRTRKRQPYDENLLRPCMIIDVPEVLREVVTTCGAHPTHPGAGAIIEDYAKDIDEYSGAYRVMVESRWPGYNGDEHP